MEYRQGRRPCRYQLDCYFLRHEDRCRFYHPQEHRDIVARQANSQRNESSRSMRSQQGFGCSSTHQYPNDPNAYQEIERQNHNPPTRNHNNRPSNYNQIDSHQTSTRNQNDRGPRNPNRPSHQTTRHPHQQHRPNHNNPDRQRSRDLTNNNRPEYHNHSPEYTYPRRNFRRQDRRSPEYPARPYGTQQRNNHNSDKENDQNQNNHYPQVKPQRNEIKMNFGSSKQQKIQQEQPLNDYNYQPSMQWQDKLPGLFPPQPKDIDPQHLLQVSRQVQTRVARDRIALTHQQQRRRKQQLRELRIRPNQERYFYNNQRLMQENRRMIEQNRIQQQERERLDRQFPSMEDVYQPGESAATRRYGDRREYVFELQHDPFIDDGYGAEDDNVDYGLYDEEIPIVDENAVTEENFHWFLRHCKYIDARTLTLEQADYFQSCCVCLHKFSQLISQPQEKVEKAEQIQIEMEEKLQKQQKKQNLKKKNKKSKNNNENDDQFMLLQLYCHQKHIYHKSCGIEWLKKQLQDEDNVAQKSYCPKCRTDFRDHPIFSQHDPNYRTRFIPLPPSFPDNDNLPFQLSSQSQSQLDIVDWRQEMRRLYNRGRDPFLRMQRMRRVIEMVEEREREWEEAERRRRERRRRIREREMEEESSLHGQRREGTRMQERQQQRERRQLHYASSMDSSHYPDEQSRLYPIDSQSNINSQPSQSRQPQNMNPEQNRQYWAKVWAEEPQENPFDQEKSEKDFTKKNSQSSN